MIDNCPLTLVGVSAAVSAVASWIERTFWRFARGSRTGHAPRDDPALVTPRVTIRLRDGMDQSIERRAARA
jgi:hypothetical protein